MDGAEAVIDVSSVMTTSAKRSVAFFETATRTLQQAESTAGVGHHLALSIVGIDDDRVKRPTLELSLPGTYWRGTTSRSTGQYESTAAERGVSALDATRLPPRLRYELEAPECITVMNGRHRPRSSQRGRGCNHR